MFNKYPHSKYKYITLTIYYQFVHFYDKPTLLEVLWPLFSKKICCISHFFAKAYQVFTAIHKNFTFGSSIFHVYDHLWSPCLAHISFFRVYANIF